MDEHGIENHPELMDPDWQRHAEKEAWVDLRRTRRRARRGRRLAIVAVVLVVVTGAGFAFYRWGKATSEQYTGASPASAPVAGATSAATTTAPICPTSRTWTCPDRSTTPRRRTGPRASRA